MYRTYLYFLPQIPCGRLTAELAERGTVVENVLMCAIAPRARPAGVASTVLVLVATFLCTCAHSEHVVTHKTTRK